MNEIETKKQNSDVLKARQLAEQISQWLSTPKGIDTVKEELEKVEESIQSELETTQSISSDILNKSFNL